MNYQRITNSDKLVKGNAPYSLRRSIVDPSFKESRLSSIPLEEIEGYDAAGNLIFRRPPQTHPVRTHGQDFCLIHKATLIPDYRAGGEKICRSCQIEQKNRNHYLQQRSSSHKSQLESESSQPLRSFNDNIPYCEWNKDNE